MQMGFKALSVINVEIYLFLSSKYLYNNQLVSTNFIQTVVRNPVPASGRSTRIARALERNVSLRMHRRYLFPDLNSEII